MEEDNLLNVCASKFINESGLRDVGAYDNKPHGDWDRKLVDIDSANHLIFEWYYRGEPIAKTVDDEWVTDNPAVRAFIISRAKEMMKELRNKDIMEEKKTKKMTKAEAFEWLKGTKVKCYERSNALYCELVEKITTECGCVYNGFMSPPDVSVFAIHIDAAGYIRHLCTVDADKYNELKCEEISADDILSIEIVEEKEETENINIELEKWIGVVRKKFCCNGWSFVISASNFALIKGDLIEERIPNK